MSPAERDSYTRQFEQAARHLPRGHVINHCTWRDGRLSVQSAKPERVAKPDEAEPRIRRGIHADLFD